MAGKESQTKPSPSVSISMSIQEILDAACPECQQRLRNILAKKLHAAINEGILDSQLKGKPDGS